LRFPAEYRAFLLNYNGGGFDVPRGRGQAARALRFHRLLDPWRLPPYRGRVAAFRRPWADLRTMIHVYRHDYFRMTDNEEIDRVWTNFLPVAHAAEPDVWDIFLGLPGAGRGRVYEFDYLHGACPQAMKTVAPSLGRFLHRCERLIGSR
jgi:hypothetical protein